MWLPCDKRAERQVKDSRRPGMTSKLLFTRDAVIRMCIPFLFFLGVKNCLAFLIFPYPVPVPKNCDCGSNFESRASQVGLHKQKKAYDKTWTGLIKHGLKSRFYGSVHFGVVVVD